MKYIQGPRWRYLAIPFILAVFVPGLVITFISIGTINATWAIFEALDWALYEDEA